MADKQIIDLAHSIGAAMSRLEAYEKRCEDREKRQEARDEKIIERLDEAAEDRQRQFEVVRQIDERLMQPRSRNRPPLADVLEQIAQEKEARVRRDRLSQRLLPRWGRWVALIGAIVVSAAAGFREDLMGVVSWLREALAGDPQQ